MEKKNDYELAKESLSNFLESLGATSKAGYRLVDMLKEDYEEDQTEYDLEVDSDYKDGGRNE